MFKLGMLALLCFVSLLLFYSLTTAIVSSVYGIDLFSNPDALDGLMKQDAAVAMKWMNAGQQLGFFLLPALLFTRLIDLQPIRLLRLDQGPSFMTTLVVCMLMYMSTALVDLVWQLNQSMSLPSFLSGLEETMKSLEDQATEITEAILAVDTTSGLLVNLFVIALLPALGEELLFRGLIQRFFGEWARNIHVGIWLSAAAFSFMHMQFYGFLPRLLLGAMFGYLYVWSGNLWVPIVAHFLNNALAVVLMYVVTVGYFPEIDMEDAEITTSVLVLSLIFTVMGLYTIYMRGKRAMDYMVYLPHRDDEPEHHDPA